MSFFLPFLIGLMILAVIFRQDAVLTVIYLLLAVYLFGRWWSDHAMKGVSAERVFSDHAFLNQKIPVKLSLVNHSWLPLVWLQVHESLPLALISPAFVRQVVSIPPKSGAEIHYELKAHKRGYYPVGPLKLLSGDLMGMTPDRELVGEVDHVTIYPEIVSMHGFSLFSRSPFGELRSYNPIFEDTSRTLGKRDYVTGDSLRRVDWKTSAASGRLQVKTYQPSMSLEIMVCLDLNLENYDPHTRIDLSEVAVIAAASTANWAVSKKQPVGFITNGLDPLAGGQRFQTLQAGRGGGSLMNILEMLARVEPCTDISFLPLLQREISRLPWGTNLLLITGKYDHELQETIFQAQRMGFNAGVILVGSIPAMTEIIQRGRRYHFRVWNILHQSDLEFLE